MLLKTLTITNGEGSVLELPVDDISNGFVVEKIENLGPVKATLVSSSFANLDGEQYHSSSRESRNIVINLRLDPNYTSKSAYDLRAELYSFLMPKTEAKFSFKLFNPNALSVLDQELNVEIFGRIETFEPDIFSRSPALTLSVMCYKPEFVDPNELLFQANSVSNLDEVVLDYKGTVETGFLFTLHTDRNVPEFTLYHRRPDFKLNSMHFTSALTFNDKLDIKSVLGSKYVTLTRAGVETSKLYSLSPQSNWLELLPGKNYFRLYADGGSLPYTINYNNKYGGL